MPAEQPSKIETRTISGRGLIKWKPDRAYRRFWINCQVQRLPQQNFLSKKINPDRSEYAQITFIREGSVLREDRMNFEFQTFTWEQDMTGYIAYQINCWFISTQELLSAIALKLGLPVLEGDTIYSNPVFDQFDSIKFVVRPDAAIVVDFWGLKYDENCGYGQGDSPPPPPPPKKPPVPPGTSIDVSPPYRYPDDNNDTQPLDLDELPEPPPEGGACILYNVTVRIFQVEGEPIEGVFQLYGEFNGAGIGNDGNSVYVVCRGGPASIVPPAGECLEELTQCFVYGNAGSAEPTLTDALIVSISPA